MRFKILAVIFLLVCFNSLAQDEGKVVHTLKGKIIDAATNEAVSYTNIGLEGTLYGTASDGEGNFELKIPAEFTTKNIYFSAVGFTNKMFPVSSLFNKEYHIIKLESKSYGIEDIDVAAQSKVLIRILRMASENIPVNFIGGPFNLICSYENKKTIDDTIQIVEIADVVIYDRDGYFNPSKMNAFKSVNYEIKKQENTASDYRFSTGTTQIEDLLGLDWVRSASSLLNPDLLPAFQLKLLDEPVADNHECWEISFSQATPSFAASGDFYAVYFEGKIVIGKNDYDVKRITGKIRSEKNSPQGRSLAVKDSYTGFLTNVLYDFEIQYSNLKPDYFMLNKNYLHNGNTISEKVKLTVNQVQTINLNKINSRDYFTGD